MPFNNQQYVYDHLPARFRRDDPDSLLKRFLQHFGETLDGWDTGFDTFHQSITPATATLVWIEFWLLQLFGWSWFPWWFRLDDKRQLYANFARHLARRGTRRGIELWLADFGITARVHTRTAPWAEFVWGETSFGFNEPLHIVVEIISIRFPQVDACAWGEGPVGEAYYTSLKPLFSGREIVRLIRYVQPHAQEISVIWRTEPLTPASSELFWEQISW